jgi:hypothetical protein
MNRSAEVSDREEQNEMHDQPVQKFRKKLAKSGSSGGVSLHFNADFAAQYGLDADTEVDVEVVERDGDVEFRIGNIPAGFTFEELEDFAESHQWEETDRYVDDTEWYLTYRNSTGDVRVEIDSEARINGSAVNNVIVESNPIEVTGDMAKYNRVCAAAQRKDLDVHVTDSKGLWQRLRASRERDTDDAPDEKVFQQLSSQAERVTAQFVCQRTSLNTSLEQLGEIVAKTQDAIEEFDSIDRL